jgi:hypothetical protein
MTTKSIAQLRAKTDQELAILVAKQFHHTAQLARAGNYIEAAELYAVSLNLLRVTNLTANEAARMEKLRINVRQLIELPLGATA